MSKIIGHNHKRWDYKGCFFGACMINRKLNLLYSYIPKNSSTWLKRILEYNNTFEHEWEHKNYLFENFENFKNIVILRDPFERYISGLAEYLTLYQSSDLLNDDAFKIIFDLVTVDDHTDRQLHFLDGLNFDNTTFFINDANLSNNIKSFLDLYNIRYTEELLAPFHVSNVYTSKYMLMKYIKSKITPEIKKYILKYYEFDYKFIHRVLEEKNMKNDYNSYYDEITVILNEIK